jgi:GLPGLI family protein
MRLTCIMILLLLLQTNTFAQQILLNGKITFERKLNVIKAMDEEREDDDDNEWYSEMRKKLPKYKTDVYQLNFNTRQTLYTTIQEDEHPMLRWQKTVTELTQKTVFGTDSTWANRTVFDKTYVVADSIMKPQWKFTGEYREIAGYNCRRATTILYDSVYVIAFYTDAIPLSGGPDMFAGLPGMILGVVIPRLNTTIFATKVESAALTETDFTYKRPRKAAVFNRAGYRNDIYTNTERWGSYANRFLLKALF